MERLHAHHATGTTTKMGVSLGARAGVETMRVSDERLLAFVQIGLPRFVSRDADHGIVDQWLPAAGLGVGALF